MKALTAVFRQESDIWHLCTAFRVLHGSFSDRACLSGFTTTKLPEALGSPQRGECILYPRTWTPGTPHNILLGISNGLFGPCYTLVPKIFKKVFTLPLNKTKKYTLFFSRYVSYEFILYYAFTHCIVIQVS
jgi:hypothetical protein